MVIISGTIKVESEEELARVKAALIGRAARSRRDAGNIDYVFSQSLEDPTEIRLIEKWESEDLLNAHLQVPDEEFNTLIATARIEKAVVNASDVTNDRILMER